MKIFTRTCLAFVGLAIGSDVALSDQADLEATFEWPAVLAVGRNQAVISNDRIYLEGDVLTFAFHEDTLWANGEVWQSFSPRQPDTSAAGLWVQELRQRYDADTTGTQEERVQSAVEAMDHAILSPDTPVAIDGSQVRVRFRSSTLPYIILLVETDKTEPLVAARKSVNLLRDLFKDYTTTVLVTYPDRSYYYGGIELLQVLKRAARGEVSEKDLGIAKKYYVLEAVRSYSLQNQE